MYKKFDSHIHFNINALDIIEDFKDHVNALEGFILILNTMKEKEIFLEHFFSQFREQFPLSVIAFSYELASEPFIKSLMSRGIRFGIKLHPRLSNITRDKFPDIAEIVAEIDPEFIIVDCFYYGSNMDTHTNLDLAIFIAKYFQEKNILLAHGGGHKLLEYMLYTRELNNIYYDLSLTVNYLQNTSVKQDMLNFIKYNYQRVFFGSDYPDFKVETAEKAYLDLIEQIELNGEAKEMLFSKNIKAFLNMDGGEKNK